MASTRRDREENTSGGRRSFGWVVNYVLIGICHGQRRKAHTRTTGLSVYWDLIARTAVCFDPTRMQPESTTRSPRRTAFPAPMAIVRRLEGGWAQLGGFRLMCVLGCGSRRAANEEGLLRAEWPAQRRERGNGETSCGIALNSTTRRHPRLGLVAGSRGPTQIHSSGASATGPVSWRTNSAPSHRADEPPGPQAPGKQARLVHTDRTDRSGRGARMRCPGASVLCLSPPLVALLLARLAIRSGQSHPGLYTQLHQPGSG